MNNKSKICIFILLITIIIIIFILTLKNNQNNEYLTVTFYSNGGDNTIIKKIEKGSILDKPEDPIRDGYIFINWFTDNDELYDFNSRVENDITLFAKWEIDSNVKQYVTVTFNSEGGSNVLSQNVVKSDKVSKPTNPKRTDYVFLGWYTENDELYDFNSPVESDITLFAKWFEITESIEYVTVEFQVEDGNSISIEKVIKGQAINRPTDPIKKGYVFLGWYTSDGKIYDFNTPVNNNVLLKAKWNKESAEIKYVTVTFNSDGGSSISKQKIIKDSKVSKPTNPIRSGYTFLGWYTKNDELYNFNNSVNSDITLYARWQKISSTAPEYVTVTFNSNGGSSVSQQRVIKNNKITKPANPIRSGYIFLGWYTKNDELYNFNNSINSDITLYARWQKTAPAPEYVTVTFNSNGGSSVSKQNVIKGNKVTKPANPTRSGYTFIGWYTNSKQEFNFSSNVFTNITLSALWAPKIKYNQNTNGKWIFINNPENLASSAYLADEAKQSIYSDTINGNAEIFYSHYATGELAGKIYYAIRVFNPSKTKAINLTINNCGVTSTYNYFDVWEQYYNKKCSIKKTFTIQPNSYKYIYHNGSSYTFGDESDISKVKKLNGSFHGIINLTTNGELKMAAIAFKDVNKTDNNHYLGNFEDIIDTNFGKVTNARYMSGSHNGLPIVENNVTFEIYNETPKGNLKVSFEDINGKNQLNNQWKTNTSGAIINTKNYTVAPIGDAQTSDILELTVPLRNGKYYIAGEYPKWKETRSLIHASGNSIKGWPYGLGNWTVHYNENITIKNKSSSTKSVSFIVSDAEYLVGYYNNSIKKCSGNNDCNIWTVNVLPNQTITVSAVLNLCTNTNGVVIKKVVLNN